MTKRRTSPLPGRERLDEAIAAALDRYDAVPLAHRTTIALIAEIAAELSAGRLVALLSVARALRDAEREEA